MKRITKFALIILITVLLGACKKGITLQEVSNRPPVAYAGPARYLVLPVNYTELSGSAEDPDGNIVNYEWTKINGPAQYIVVNSKSPVTAVNDLIEGVYLFELKVTDHYGLSSTDNVEVHVSSKPNKWDYE